MPIYEYHALDHTGCEKCSNSFEVMQKLSAPAINLCPECHQPVRRKISRPSLSNADPSLQQKNIEKHGFTQFKKIEKGVYEKTAGKGPRYIMDKKDS